MAAVVAFYEVWDDSTGNRLGEFQTLGEACVLLRQMVSDHGADAVRALAVLAYSPSGLSSDDYEVVTVLEGTEFLAGQGRVTRSAS